MDLLLDDSGSTLGSLRVIGEDVATIKQTTLVSNQFDSRTLREWLHPLDTSANHNAARSKHQHTTNEWFIGGEDFTSWKSTIKSLLWLYGIPGCGKTIISSSIIANLMEVDHDSKATLAYFYFDFNDRGKQTTRGMIYSLLSQMSTSSEALTTIQLLYTKCDAGRREPMVDELKDTLFTLFSDLGQIHLVIDALDECGDREQLLSLITEIVSNNDLDVRILMTSRREGDIEGTLAPIVPNKINIQSALVNDDIRTFVKSRLSSNARLIKWCRNPDIKDGIETTLMTEAHGMYE